MFLTYGLIAAAALLALSYAAYRFKTATPVAVEPEVVRVTRKSRPARKPVATISDGAAKTFKR